MVIATYNMSSATQGMCATLGSLRHLSSYWKIKDESTEHITLKTRKKATFVSTMELSVVSGIIKHQRKEAL